MKQLVQSNRTGSIDILDVPSPFLKSGGVLVRTAASVISSGTERAALEFAKSSLVNKARTRPDLVKQLLQKVRRDGLAEAVKVALSRLDRPAAPGYACAGTVIASDVSEFNVGDRVACAGAGYATHAEVNFVPKNLVVPIPAARSGEPLGFDEASFTTLGAIALHGVRLAQPQLGDKAVVIGLGAIGLLTVQILRAHGCQVAGVDLNAARCDLAERLGAQFAKSPGDMAAAVNSWTRGLGADLVLVAAATDGSEPAVLAADLSRDKGRIVAVGATGMDIPRRTLFQKEVSVVVSRSYGPGRYDPEYEERGRDYPLPYVRWTERENMRAFIELVADGRVDVRSLISHRFDIPDAARAYELLESESALVIVLDYPGASHSAASTRVDVVPVAARQGARAGTPGVSLIGAGNFARGVLLPAFARQADVRLRGVVTATGVSARSAAERFKFAYCSTIPDDIWSDADCDAVVIATRHDTHAGLVMRSLNAQKAVFVEKPLCLTDAELDEIEATMRAAEERGDAPFLMVGFNRRFAPTTRWIKSQFSNVEGPVNVVYRVNAGRLPTTSWVVNSDEGGGRILGEVCHFVDLCSYLAGSPISQVSAVSSTSDADEVIVTLTMANGGIATIAYLVDGDPAMPKEHVEVFGGGTIGIIDDFRQARVSRGGKKHKLGGRFSRQDKGHAAEVAAFVKAVGARQPSPVPSTSAVNVTRATLAILESMRSRASIDVR